MFWDPFFFLKYSISTPPILFNDTLIPHTPHPTPHTLPVHPNKSQPSPIIRIVVVIEKRSRTWIGLNLLNPPLRTHWISLNPSMSVKNNWLIIPTHWIYNNYWGEFDLISVSRVTVLSELIVCIGEQCWEFWSNAHVFSRSNVHILYTWKWFMKGKLEIPLLPGALLLVIVVRFFFPLAL